MSILDALLQSLRDFLALDQPAGARDDVLRLGCALFLLSVYVIVPLLVLRDRARPAAAPPVEPSPPPEMETGTRRALAGGVYAALLAVLVAVFPWAYERGQHAFLAATAMVASLLAWSESRHGRLQLRPPRRTTGRQALGLLALCAGVAILTLWRWDQVPVGMHGDEAKCGLAALRMYRDGQHPFFMNEAGIPAMLQSLDGLVRPLVDDPVLGLRLVPLLCAIVAPVVLFRWMSLIGSPTLAWFGTLLFVTTPFFQHYSRTPTGVTLVLAQLVFLYGLTRCLAAPGLLGPLLGGLGLGIAQWDYYAARTLLLFLGAVPLLLLPYWKQLAPGWWRRLPLLALVALPLILCFTLMANYPHYQWSFYIIPRSDPLPPSASPMGQVLLERLGGHFPMWFSAVPNKIGAITVPGSPVLPFPLGALALVGAGVLALSALRAPGMMVIALLLIGLVPSIVTDGPPNGHRIMTAEVAVAVLLGLGSSAIWPRAGSGPVWISGARKALALAVVAAGCIAGVRYFQVDMWAYGGNAWAQEIDVNLRARRLREDGGRYQMHVVPETRPVERLVLGDTTVAPLDFGHWLPANWSALPVSVNGLAERHALVGLPKSALRRGDWQEFFAVDGLAAGWRYRTDGERLGRSGVARQWRERHSITGTLMVPDAGTLGVSCPGFRFTWRSPLHDATIEGEGRFPVQRGLAEVEIAPLANEAEPPATIEVSYETLGSEARTHRLQPADLYSVPVRGWLRQVFASDRSRPDRELRIETAVLPTLYVWWGMEEEWPKPSTQVRRTVYSAVADLPPGVFALTAYVNPPRAVRITVGRDEIVPFAAPDALREGYDFTLDSRTANGQLIVITRIDDGDTQDVSRFAVAMRIPGDRDEVPPYGWFRPAPTAPAALTGFAGRPSRSSHPRP